MKSNNVPNRQHMQRGVSLLEVLVTALILSIGMMGLLGNQLVALKMNQAAASRSIASEYAYAMMDKIRSNSAAANNGDYDVGALTLASAIPAGSGVAGTERKLWANQLQRALPGALVQICRRTNMAGTFTGCAAAGEYFMVRVAWQQGEDARLMFDATRAVEGPDSQSVEIVGRI
ncbi:MAG: type IV pilus modification protein PilV [Zoogloeaceae bacterium]|jgi:type IV pilus assembly protein PilV|nr:type IV pilus modification protein PilV [Zoogloeaceae bacterium]